MREHSERIDHRIGRSLADACDALVQWKLGDPAGAVAQMRDAADELITITPPLPPDLVDIRFAASRFGRNISNRLFEIKVSSAAF